MGHDTQSEHQYPALNTTQMQPLGQPPQTMNHLEPTGTERISIASTASKGSQQLRFCNAGQMPHQADDTCLESQKHTTIMPRVILEAYLTPAVLQRLGIALLDLAYYWDIDTLEPPITKASLSELDLVRIINDPKLRHDINFEREISFKPNDRGEHVIDKRERAEIYWEAMIIELSLYSHRQRLRNTKVSIYDEHTTSTAQLTELPTLRHIAIRLPRTIETIREIIKTLVPGSEWAAVDERLDVQLLIQELENGVCDIKGLANWFQSLLLRSCSPLRDPLVHKMVALVHGGVDKDDARLLAVGLRELFGILETMKLVRNKPRLLCIEN